MNEQEMLTVLRARMRQLVDGCCGSEMDTMLAAAAAWSKAAAILEAKTYDPADFGPAFLEALKREQEEPTDWELREAAP